MFKLIALVLMLCLNAKLYREFRFLKMNKSVLNKRQEDLLKENTILKNLLKGKLNT